MLLRLTLVLFSLSYGVITHAQSNFDNVIIFGDSLSDTGNLASGVGVDFPFPFFENRISNGPVLVDFLAQELGFEAQASEINNGNNFAVAGGNILGQDREDLIRQVDSFLSRSPSGVVSSDSLYFVMMGGNDLRDIRSVTSSAQAQVQIDVVLDQLEAQLNRLYDAGARTFLVANVANVGRIPETLALLGTDPQIASRAESYVRAYNVDLNERLNLFKEKPGVSLNLYDLFSQFESLISNADALGFTQTEVGCFNIDGFQFQPECEFGARFDRFVFFDSIHPTAKSNQIGSASLIASIPVPATDAVSNSYLSAIISLILLD